MRAAMLARAARDLDAVERLARAAFAEGPDPIVARALAEVLYERGRFAEALDVFAGVEAMEADGESAAVLASARATVLGFGLLRLDEAVQVLRDARDAAAEPALRSRLAARLAATEMWRSGPVVALAELDAQPLEPSVAGADAAARAPLLALAGRTKEALDVSGGEDLEPPELPGTPEVGRVLVLVEAGRLDAADALARRCYAATARARLPLPQLWFAGGMGRVALRRGRAGEALRWFREQVALSRELDQGLPLALALGGLLTAAVWSGDDATLAEAWAGWQASGAAPDAPTMLPADVASGLAWRSLQVGDLEGAHALLDACVRRCLEAGSLVQAAAAAYERVRLLRPAAVADDLRTLAAETDSPVVAAWSSHASAGADGDVDGLEAAAEQLWELGLVLSSVEATTAAAAAARRDGDPRRAQALSRQAAGRRGTIPGVTTPGLLAAVSPAGGLTPREKEIALLVAQGRSSKEIAAALVLSVRTVDNHLQRVFTKLGVTSRAEVKDALEEDT
jgi:DNA-binding CsgD family transcriptional regulator/tetratricopeptide (TPR) repeat protein